jgi:hypothetical protein
MESQSSPKKSSKEMVKKKSKSILTMSRKSSNEKNDESPAIHTPREHPFIIAAHNAIESKNYSAIQFYLRNPYLDPNITDQQGYSTLQIFIKEKSHQGVELFLTDYRVHFRYKDLYKEENTNQQQKYIIDYINKHDEETRALYHKIFARFTLDMVTDQQCKNMKPFYQHGLLTDTVFAGTIQKIKNKIQKDAITQIEQQNENDGNPVLPESACLPEYATDEFIEKRIWFLLSLKES